MKQYRGCYIDGVIFHSKAEIDIFLREQAIESFRKSVRWFIEKPDIEHSIYSNERAENLIKHFGFTPSQVEEIEINVMMGA